MIIAQVRVQTGCALKCVVLSQCRSLEPEIVPLTAGTSGRDVAHELDVNFSTVKSRYRAMGDVVFFILDMRN